MPDNEGAPPAVERDGSVGVVPGPAPVRPPTGTQAQGLASELSERVVQGVGWLRSRTTVPALTVMRAVVYGLIVIAGAIGALVFGVLGVVRIWDAYVPLGALGRRVWLGYVIIGGALFLAGGALLSWRRSGKA
ncbi:MAG: hypothetical protein ACRDZX_10755 [Acidimicrobiales bacterium]